MHSFTVIALAAVALAQNNPPPSPILLTSTKSGVLPVLPTPFNGVETLEGAIIQKGPPNPAYAPVLGPALVQSNLPAATYVATLPSVPFDGLTGTVISGSISGSAKQGAQGVTFHVSFDNFPSVSQYGPFLYHIHDMPVPADGNCTSTMGHFDATNSGEYYPCIISSPQNCQTGDLAGKHGTINGTSFSTSFVDDYLSTDPSSPYFFGSKSIVIHTSNTTRLTCANFMLSTNSTSPSVTTPSSTTSASPTHVTAGASKTVTGSLVAGFFGLLIAI